MVDVNRTAALVLDDFVEAFESARETRGEASLLDFLPPADHPDFAAVATELVRIDMEQSWNDGRATTIEQYRRMLPGVLADPATLASVAFEEYRLRALAGEAVDKADYSRRFAISTDRWPLFGPQRSRGKQPQRGDCLSPDDVPSADDSPVQRVWEESLRLADDVVEFPAVGTSLGEFVLERELGRGAFAHVYLARQVELADRPVVLKVASGRTLEPQHLARLQHTNIVPIYSVHQVGEFTAACMPYLGSRTLADAIGAIAGQDRLPTSGAALVSTIRAAQDATLPALSPEAVVATTRPADAAADAHAAKHLAEIERRTYVDAVADLIRQTAEGLAHAHQRGIVHRDLKPANILLADDARPLLLDFNLSDSVVVNGRPSVMVGGTLPYMSPEQLRAVRAGGHVDPRSDIYSLGMILFELLAGRRPYDDRRGGFEAVVEGMLADRGQTAPDVRRFNHAVPPSVASIVARCLAPDAKDRYQTADELAEDLRRQLSDLPLRHAPNPSVKELAQKWSRRHPQASSAGVVATVAAGVLLAVGAIGLRWHGERNLAALRAQLPTLRAELNVVEADPDLIDAGIEHAEAALAQYGIDRRDQWRGSMWVRALNAADSSQLNSEIGETAFLLAEAHARRARGSHDDRGRKLALGWNQVAGNSLAPTSSSAIVAQRAAIQDSKLNHSEAEESDFRESAAAQMAPPAGTDEPQEKLEQRFAAMRLLGAGQFRRALPALEHLRNASPNDPSAWLMLGNAHTALGNGSQAEVCFDAAAALLPSDAHYVALYNRGLLRYEAKRYEGALADFDEVVRRKPLLVCGYLNRGLIRQALGRHEEAVADFSKAIELGTKQTRVYFLRSRSETALGQTDEAKRDFDQGIERQPADALSWIARGVARMATNPAVALADFRTALAQSPGHWIALQNIVHVTADRLDRKDEADAALDEMLAIRPGDPWALAGRAVLGARQGDRQAALADLEALLQTSRQPVHYFQAACALALLGDGEATDGKRAMSYLAKAVVAEPALAGRAQTDPDLESLRQRPDFSTVIAAASAAPPPAGPSAGE